MKSKRVALGGVIACILLFSYPVSAHHAWTGYDMAKLTTVKGTVTKFDWTNPHVWISFDVMGDKGKVEQWSGGGPSLIRMSGTGWEKNTIKPGDQITVVGNRISDGTYKIRMAKVVLSNGREMTCYTH